MEPTYAAERFHDVSFGHRVFGHESKCAHAHGHNYRIHFHCRATDLDALGRVIDFSVIKSKLCIWLEDRWDHKFLLFVEDPWLAPMQELDPNGVVGVPFNPTAENIAGHLLTVIGPMQLRGSGVTLVKVIVEETRKCSASAAL